MWTATPVQTGPDRRVEWRLWRLSLYGCLTINSDHFETARFTCAIRRWRGSSLWGARKLKYYSPETDYAALERELAATSARSGSSSYDDEDYSDLAAKYNDDFDDEDDLE